MQDKGKEHTTPVLIPEFLNQAYYRYAGRYPPPTPEQIRLPPREAWAFSVWVSSYMAEGFMDAGYHKQIGNRLIEPGQYINVLITATEWSNFYLLRDHEAAEPSIRALAQEMRRVQGESKAKVLQTDEWHLPYVSDIERATYDLPTLLKLSTARSARLSYLTVEGEMTTVEKDIDLHDRLLVEEPPHSSPAEHQAKPGSGSKLYFNLRGWKSYRYLLEHNQLACLT